MIVPDCGTRQRFRLRHHDLVIRGTIDDLVPPVEARLSLNGGAPRPFYVEELPDNATDWISGYKRTPAELRCRELGEFCVEIPVGDPALRRGANTVELGTRDKAGHAHRCMIAFDWDPTPLPLPLDLRDLTRFAHIQEVGQPLNGKFELDRAANAIRSVAPVAPDAFLILGSPHGSQEATFAVRFTDPPASKWLGLADFMAGQEEGVPPRGLKVGWSSAGMAAFSPRDGARSFIAWGDHSGAPQEWAIATNPAARFGAVEAGRRYRVRHQVRFANGIDQVRFRMWPEGEREPDSWLCQEQDDRVPAHLPRHSHASFGLFQHLGAAMEWSDILVVALDPAAGDPIVPGNGREPFLGRKRPGAF